MPFVLFFGVVATLFASWRLWRRTRYFLHVYQLEGYKGNEYRAWLLRHARRVGVRRSHVAGAGVLAAAGGAFAVGGPVAAAAVALPAWAVAFASSKLYRSARQKKPLAYTSRMKRLLGAAAVLALAPVALGTAHLVRRGARGVFGFLLGWLVADLFAPVWVALAGAATKPVEDGIQEGFKRKARARLARQPNLTTVGITGSYGKTSVKFILAEILRQRYSVLATPSSYNTPMGICLVVNRKLRPEHQMLVLEMGMRYPGDIEELCEIARPDIGVVTSVGVAHLETMGSIEAIEEEKGSLLTHMKEGGIAVLNADDPRVAAMRARATGDVWTVSVEGNEADVSAHDVRYGADGASFVVRDETGAEATFRTRLLGRHNVLNILLGVAVGRALGLRLRQIARAVSRVQPVEHRLALREENGVTVIDDAFNSNPVGARNAVEILGAMQGGRRVIVTPGMVELGERQAEENRTFGTHIARHADLAVLVGRAQTTPIRDGLRDAGFPDEKVHVADSLFDAQAYLRTVLEPGDFVLYENDLPDQYDEVTG